MKFKSLFFLYILYLIIITAFSYFIIYNKTVEKFKDNIFEDLGRLTLLTSELIDKDSLQFIINNLDINNIDADSIESTLEFKKLQNQLLFINSVYPNISSWSYIYYPTDNTNTVLLLIYTDTEGVKFGDPYDISLYPVMINSINDKTKLFLEKQITYDEGFNVWVTSAFSPIINNEQYLGHIGIDMFVDDLEDNLYSIRINTLLLAISIVFIGGIFLPQVLYKIYLYIKSDNFKILLKKRKLKKLIKKALKGNR